ncbi:DUF6542 domain-containing protein [Streptomyces sp. NPDC012751]|uniref:DUF6542 domain-containing protein n=1 Tax=Streptomyces sp. NPDC012751 TaxID=3364846 RepID=UPI0036C2B51C
MEQRRERPPNDGRRRGRPRQAPLPPQARRRAGGDGRGYGYGGGRLAGQSAGAAQAGEARPGTAGGRLPNPRLTGLGSGLFCAVAMFLLGCLDQVLFGASPAVYGVLFLPVCALTALWVRDGDVLSAPVVLPIAFAVGLLPVAEGGGPLGRLMGLVTGLATQAGWLYGGTLAAGVIVLARRVRWVRRRRRRG